MGKQRQETIPQKTRDGHRNPQVFGCRKRQADILLRQRGRETGRFKLPPDNKAAVGLVDGYSMGFSTRAAFAAWGVAA